MAAERLWTSTKWIGVLGLVMALAACSSGRGDKLINLNRGGDGTPDEFAILPTKPIEIPQDLNALPAPTPGGANRVDPTPQADAVAALGGNPERLNRTGQARSDGGLIRYASRYGVQSGIRPTLAQEDVAFRKANPGRVLERLFRVTRYYSVYEGSELDQTAELQKWRRRGVLTPSAPPEGQD